MIPITNKMGTATLTKKRKAKFLFTPHMIATQIIAALRESPANGSVMNIISDKIKTTGSVRVLPFCPLFIIKDVRSKTEAVKKKHMPSLIRFPSVEKESKS